MSITTPSFLIKYQGGETYAASLPQAKKIAIHYVEKRKSPWATIYEVKKLSIFKSQVKAVENIETERNKVRNLINDFHKAI